MVINSTNINKTSNHISPEESLNVIVCFVDMGGIVDHHCLNIL
jgi:hypothetical protein